MELYNTNNCVLTAVCEEMDHSEDNWLNNVKRELNEVGIYIYIYIYTLTHVEPVVHNWFIKGRGMYCSVYGKVHIKDPLLLIEKSSLCGGSGFPSKKCVNVTIWMTSNNRW